MKKVFSLQSLMILSLIFVFQSCKPRAIADVTIKYEITCTNPNRPVYVRYLNENGDEDQVVVTSTHSKSIIIASNVSQKKYYVDFTCYEKYANGNFESQTVDIKLIEDNVTVKKESWAGSSELYSNHSTSTKYVSYMLPTRIKYKD